MVLVHFVLHQLDFSLPPLLSEGAALLPLFPVKTKNSMSDVDSRYYLKQRCQTHFITWVRPVWTSAYKGLTTHLILEICYETVCFTACVSITKMSHSLFRTIISGGALVWLTVSSNSSSSFLATKGHQPLILFCLKMETMGISPSFVTISMVHCLGVLAPRGKRFKSSSIAPMKTFFLQ